MPDGILFGRSFELGEWQRAIVLDIYDNPAGTRRAIVTYGRKNGKTALAAALLLLHLAGPEAKPNSELYSSALSRDQAAILYRLAAKMVRMSPILAKDVVTRDTVKQLACSPLGTQYTALSADAATNFGLSPVFIVHDELGQVRGPRHTLYEALETATGAQIDPLSIIISTQAPNDADLLSVLIDDAEAQNDERTLLFMFSAPVDADPFTKKTIKLANPAFGKFQNEREVLDMAEGARRMPSREAEYRNLILNQRVEASNPFISKTTWERNGEQPSPKLGECYGGLDLSTVNDLTAFVVVSPNGDYLDVHPVFWLPAEGLEERSRLDRTLYDVWAKPDVDGRKFLLTTPGRSIQYEYVANYLSKFIADNDVRGIAFDKWNMSQLRPWLMKAGLSESMIDAKFVEFRQGTYSMSPALNSLESALLDGKMRHGGHPVLTMCAANAVVRMDDKGWRLLDKKRSRGRIDGMVALAMATSLAVSKSAEKHVYQVPIDRILEHV